MEQTEKRILPRYRTIRECYLEIKKIDSDTAVTEYFIRFLCKSGAIQHFLSGSKSLVNLDSLLAYLSQKQLPSTEYLCTE